MSENLRSGEVVISLTKDEAKEIKKIVTAKQSTDQVISFLLERRDRYTSQETDWWEKIYDKYLLTRGGGYTVKFETAEIVKL